VIQEINAYGRNWTCAFPCRSVIEEIDRLAGAGDPMLSANGNFTPATGRKAARLGGDGVVVYDY
jgi:hypothetical protein